MEQDTSEVEVSREQVLAVLNNSDSSACCFPFCKQTNKVLPTQHSPEDSEYFTFKPNRKIRIINKLPYSSQGRESTSAKTETSILNDAQSDKYKYDGNDAVIDDDDDDDDEADTVDEDYWFENAAPNRLPVIQPPPPQEINRIINKFEPRCQPNLISKNLDDDLISPGRLPRKNFNTDSLPEADDYEDDANVDQQSNGDQSADVVCITTGLTLDLAAEPTEKIKRNSPPAYQPPTFQEAMKSQSPESSPMSSRSVTPVGESNHDSLSSRRSKTPPYDKPVTPTRSPELADDSCHPSPDVPHRTVCAVPDPVDKNLDHETFSSVIVSGGNLGGMVNLGYSHDESSPKPDDEQEDQPAPDTEVDVGYSRNRTVDIEAIESSLIQAESTNSPSVIIPTSSQQPNKPELPILFFLHGVGGSADIWNSQLNYFVSKGYQCVAPDMLGHGFSSCPDKASAYTFTKLFKDFITIFDSYVPDGRKCVVIGHSYGCSFSVALTRTRPEKIVTLIMIASGGPTPLAPPPNLSRYPKWVMGVFRLALECRFRNQQHKYNPRGKTIKFKEAFDVPAYVFKYIMLGQVWPEGDAGFHRRITVPTLLVYGMRDTLISLVEECEMERTIPKAYLELIPMAGHCVMLETPDQLNIMMLKFIKKWTSDFSTSAI